MPAHTTLVWLPTEASIGKDYLSPSLGVYARRRRRPEIPAGHAARAALDERARGPMAQYDGDRLRLVDLVRASTSLSMPHRSSSSNRSCLSTAARKTSSSTAITSPRSRFVDLGGRVDLGWNMNRAAQLRLGYWASDRRTSSSDRAARLCGGGCTSMQASRCRARYDSRDAASFATRGHVGGRSNISFGRKPRRRSRLGAHRGGGAQGDTAFGKNLMWLSLAGGTDLGERPAGRSRVFAGRAANPCRHISTTRCGSTATGSRRAASSGGSRTWCRSRTRRSTAASACMWRASTIGWTRFRTTKSTALPPTSPGSTADRHDQPRRRLCIAQLEHLAVDRPAGRQGLDTGRRPVQVAATAGA